MTIVPVTSRLQRGVLTFFESLAIALAVVWTLVAAGSVLL